MSRSIAIINALSPPMGGSRAERWLALCRELAARGHRVTLFKAEPPRGYHSRDAGLDAELRALPISVRTCASGVAAEWAHTTQPGIRGLLAKVLGQCAWPDPWRGFGRSVVGELVAGSQGAFDVIIASAWPASDLLAGYEASLRLRIPVLFDIGDPWSVSVAAGHEQRSANFRVERAIAGHASALIVTTDGTAQLYRSQYGFAGPIHVIPSGVTLEARPCPEAWPPLRIMHAGTVYGPRVSLLPFAQAVSAARSDARIHLTWYGQIWRDAERRAIAEVSDEYEEQVPAAQVKRAEDGAHVVVVFGNEGGVQLPAKLWKALASGRIVIGVASSQDDCLHSVPELAARGKVVRNDAAEIHAALEWAVGRVASWPFTDPLQAGPLPTWKVRAQELESAIEGALAGPTPPSRWVRPLWLLGGALGPLSAAQQAIRRVRRA